MALTSCEAVETPGQDPIVSGAPQWPRLDTSDSIPEAWRFEEASPAFDLWSSEVSVTSLERWGRGSRLGLEDAQGRTVEVLLPTLPVERLVLAVGARVRADLLTRIGFEGVARGFSLRDEGGRLLILYDDGGYGPAYQNAAERSGLEVSRELQGPDGDGRWEPRDVRFSVDGHAALVSEGESGVLGESGLEARVVVSREWRGEPPTDLDLTPLAFLVYRVR